MKKIISIICAVVLFVSCEDWLDTKNITQKDNSNFPETEADVRDFVTGITAVWQHPTQLGDPYVLPTWMGDECFSAGGPGDIDRKAWSVFRVINLDDLEMPWEVFWIGIIRANMLLYTIENRSDIVYASQAAKDGYKAESYFHRAGFYLVLARFYGDIPVITDVISDNPPRDPADKVFGQICADYLKAIELFPATKWTALSPEQRAHPTKWAAQGMLARAFLYYTGYYQKEDVTLPDGSKLTKAQVLAHLVDCIENSGHGLVPDFRNLWPYSYNKARTRYKFAIDNDLEYIGEDSNDKCLESVWVLKHTYQCTAIGQAPFNRLGVIYGLRNQGAAWNNWRCTFPFGQGWGGGSVLPTLYDQWMADDPTDKRLNGSILKDDNPSVEGLVRVYYKNGTYSGTRPGGGTFANQAVVFGDWTQQTGYWVKKFVPINVWKDDVQDAVPNATTGAGPNIYTTLLYGTTHDWRWKYTADTYILRFSDILLMAAEMDAPKKQEYFDRVRLRSCSTTRPATFENIQKERRYEFAFEGLRFYDLQRWRITKQTLLANRANIPIWNEGNPYIYGDVTPGKVDVYMKYGLADIGVRLDATGGLFPVPQKQINLSGGSLIQTPGWGPNDDCLWVKGSE